MSANLKDRAFSLLEIIAVIGIVGVLVILLFPCLNGMQSTAQLVRCSNNLRQLHMAWSQYAQERNGVVLMQYDNGRTWDGILHYSGILPNPNMANNPNVSSVYQCPANHCREGSLWRGTSYAYNPSMGEAADDVNGWPDPYPRYRREKRYSELTQLNKLVLWTDASQGGDNGPAYNPAGTRWWCVGTFAWGLWPDASGEMERQVGYQWHGGRSNFMFADGHIEPLTSDVVKQRYQDGSLITVP